MYTNLYVGECVYAWIHAMDGVTKFHIVTQSMLCMREHLWSHWQIMTFPLSNYSMWLSIPHRVLWETKYTTTAITRLERFYISLPAAVVASGELDGTIAFVEPAGDSALVVPSGGVAFGEPDGAVASGEPFGAVASVIDVAIYLFVCKPSSYLRLLFHFSIYLLLLNHYFLTC